MSEQQELTELQKQLESAISHLQGVLREQQMTGEAHSAIGEFVREVRRFSYDFMLVVNSNR